MPLLPHISTYERRWVRRIMIIVNIPRELWLANKTVFVMAAHWWRQP